MNMKAIMLLALIAISSSFDANKVLKNINLEFDEPIYGENEGQAIKFIGVRKCECLTKLTCRLSYRDLHNSEIKDTTIYVRSDYLTLVTDFKN
jgi:hypothetical protein